MAERIIQWTAKEALACAYCWAEFTTPEDRTDSPEEYWRGVSERTRNECREIAKKRLLLAVARGYAVAVPPVADFKEGQLEAFGKAARLTQRHRIIHLVYAIRQALAPASGIRTPRG